MRMSLTTSALLLTSLAKEIGTTHCDQQVSGKLGSRCNGAHAGTFKVRLLEEDFHRLMFAAGGG